MITAAKSLLSNVHMYVLLQKGVGADRLRYRCLDRLDIQSDDVVLDVGCGPAYYLERLGGVKYFGFDTETKYIDWAKARWDNKNAEFHCEILTEEHLEDLPPVNKVLLFGLLHHLSDEQCQVLLKLAGKALAPGGVVISVDTCFEPTQGTISRWMSANDRGEYVRVPEQFETLASKWFNRVEGEVWNDVTRIPSSHWMMKMSEPVI